MHDPVIQQAQEEFTEVNRQAWRQRLLAFLRRQNPHPVPFEALKQQVGLREQSYRGLQAVPLERIIGSLGRSQDFDRAFRPLARHLRSKWVSVDSAHLEGIPLPPVSLYQVGDAYFIVDGHHRVSVARQKGQAFIDAEVIEVKSRVPVTADLTLEDLDSLAAYREFLEKTHLDILRPDQNIRLTMPGDYTRLIEHIKTHQYFMELERAADVSWEEAVAHWYDHVYKPIVDTIRQHNLLKDFPSLTEGDLYFWIVEHRYYLTQELGREPSPREVAQDFVARFSRHPKQILRRWKNRLLEALLPDAFEPGPPPGTWRTERASEEQGALFREILVTLTGAPSGWLALEQAAEIARREGGALRGLHVIPEDTDEARRHAYEVLEEFRARTRDWGFEATARMLQGDVVETIVDRARWADLVVINQRRIHGRLAERPLGSIFQGVASQISRPILAVPGTQIRPIERVALAYDASPKAREALYVFRHILTRWNVSGVIITAQNPGITPDAVYAAEAYARQGNAGRLTIRMEEGPAEEVILRAMGEESADLLLMGSFGHSPLLKAFLGSTVDRVLRVAWFPVIICR